MGSSPCRRISLLGVAHPVVGKYFQVLEVHRELKQAQEICCERLVLKGALEGTIRRSKDPMTCPLEEFHKIATTTRLFYKSPCLVQEKGWFISKASWV